MLQPLKHASFLLFALFLAPFLSAQTTADRDGAPSPYSPPETFEKLEGHSFYIRMRDGVDIACDLFLPANLPPGKKIPTVLHLTRYWRSFSVKWPFRNVMDPGPPSMNIVLPTEKLVESGYAVMSVDCRGSGASFGSEIIAMGPDEVEDGREILDWIVEQEWSDGQVASAGISYNGWAAQMLAVTEHPALKAIIPLHAPFDGYEDMAFPGGLFHHALINRWANILRFMDQGRVNTNRRLVKALVKGPRSIEARESALDSAIVSHQDNGYADSIMARLQFRDDTDPRVGGRSIDHFFPAGHMDAVRNCQAPVYAVSGWYDMAGPHAAVRMYRNYGSGKNKLLIGPWNHFAARKISPYAPGKATMDRAGEFIKFLDAHLKGQPELLDGDAPVHYYTIGAEKWRSAQNWPPVEAAASGFFLDAEGGLSRDEVKSPGSAVLQVDTSLGTGKQTRWDLSSRNHSTYEDLPGLQDRFLTFTGEVLDSPMEITGHPSVRLYISSEETDESIFVYLEEVTADGDVYLITEGLFRALHRKPLAEPVYTDVVPQYSFRRSDAQPLVPHQVTRIEFDLIPCSWELQAGSRLRLAISGADKDHFRPVTGNHKLEVLFGGETPSVVVVPLIPRQKGP
jgi:putative CocE/NonD family hydrolase